MAHRNGLPSFPSLLLPKCVHVQRRGNVSEPITTSKCAVFNHFIQPSYQRNAVSGELEEITLKITNEIEETEESKSWLV